MLILMPKFLVWRMMLLIMILSIVYLKHYLAAGRTMTSKCNMELNKEIDVPINPLHFINRNSHATLIRGGGVGVISGKHLTT